MIVQHWNSKQLEGVKTLEDVWKIIGDGNPLDYANTFISQASFVYITDELSNTEEFFEAYDRADLRGTNLEDWLNNGPIYSGLRWKQVDDDVDGFKTMCTYILQPGDTYYLDNPNMPEKASGISMEDKETLSDWIQRMWGESDSAVEED